MALWMEASSPEEEERLRYPADDGIPMEDLKHDLNKSMLGEILRPYLRELGQAAFVAGNVFIYYRLGQPKKCVGPDFFVVLGARDDPERDCWRVWNEGGLTPQVIVEFLSHTNEEKDRGKNFLIYRDILKVDNYFLCDNRGLRLEGFRLRNQAYQPILPDGQGRLECPVLGLHLGFWEGWLRWYTSSGSLVSTGRELAEQERQRAEQERQRAEQERQKAEQERCRADAAEAEAARLREELRRLQGGPDGPQAS